MDASSVVEALRPSIESSTRPRLLFISHAWGGGVERHVRDLLELAAPRSDVLVLRGFSNGGVDVAWYDGSAQAIHVRVGGFSESTLADWSEALRELAFDRVHVHHLHGWPRAVLSLIDELNLPIDITLHDYFFACPQYHFSDENDRYCGEPDESGCRICIEKRPHAWQMQIGEWRNTLGALLSRADRVIAPTHDVAHRIARYFPKLTPLVWAHPEKALAEPLVRKVVLLGGLSHMKGLRTVVDVVTLASKTRPELSFRLIGHASEPLPAGITASGSYEDSALPRLIAEERPDVIWFPFQVPETFNYTLSAAIASGVAIVASDFGSTVERLSTYAKKTLVPHNVDHAAWIAALSHGLASSKAQLPDWSDGEYARNYFVTNSSQMRAEASGHRLRELLSASPSAPSNPDRSIVSLFHLGRYAGHRESFEAVQSQLESLPANESQIVGRSVFDATRAHRDYLLGEVDSSKQTINQQRQQIGSQIQEIVRMRAEAAEAAANATRHIQYLESELHSIVTSRSWRWTRPLRVAIRIGRIVPRLLNTSWRVVSTDRNVLQRTWRLLRAEGITGVVSRTRREIRKTQQPDTKLALSDTELNSSITSLFLPTSDAPLLSILIPVYEQHATTFACLKSIATHFPSVATEIIIADDASPTPAETALATVHGPRFVRHGSNLGFIRNVNAAALEARGEFLLLLNNDTLVTSRAIDAMIATFGEQHDVGLVGAKLLNRDGSLQEAGGIVWRDGSAWNWGRGEHPLDPRFNYVRDVDYCSGAALLIRREMFASMNGFDEHFLPAYYEDTDLAFRVRERGLRVVYQPHAAIYHVEGVSHGTDPSKGIKAHQAVNEKRFFARWEDALKSHRMNGEAAAKEARRKMLESVLIVEACMITPDQDSGSIRLQNIMQLMRDSGRHVVFLAENLEGTAKYRYKLEAMGIEVLYDAWAGSVRHVLQERGSEFSTIVFCRHYVASAHMRDARRYAPQAKVVFDTVDLHYLREEREAELLGNHALTAKAEATKCAELEMVRAADTTVVVSPVEKALLENLVPDKPILVLSNVHQLETYRPGFQERRGALFVGGFRHPPNVDAIRWFAEEVFPRLRAIDASIDVSIIGSNMPDDLKSFEQAGLRFLGHVNDITPLLRSARVSIAPLRYGAGVKGKINEAMNFGIPVVATSLAVEGMYLQPGVDCLVADEASQFAQHIVSAHSDEKLWQTLSMNGIRSVEKHFSMDAAKASLEMALQPKP